MAARGAGVWLIAALAAGCVTSGENVEVYAGIDELPAGCEALGGIQATDGHLSTTRTAAKGTLRRAMARATAQTAAKGGNAFVMFRKIDDFAQDRISNEVTLEGEAYRCPEPPPVTEPGTEP